MSASETLFINITFPFDILVIVISMLYVTCVFKTCKNASK